MSEKTYNFILQALAIICLCFLAYCKVINGDAIVVMLGIVFGYLFKSAENHIKNDEDKKMKSNI